MRLLTSCLWAAWVVVLSTGAADAEAKTVWLCKPGLAGNPCAGSLTTTVLKADGSQSIERARRAGRPKVDCFYVYPTVSGQDGINATKTAEPEQKAVAEQQAGRFSQVCRPFAPVYRQLTLRAIEGQITAAAAQRAYGDVRSAWLDYLRNHNRGRGVVLIRPFTGHLRPAPADQDRDRSARQGAPAADLCAASGRQRAGGEGSRLGGRLSQCPRLSSRSPDRLRDRLLGLLRNPARGRALRACRKPLRGSGRPRDAGGPVHQSGGAPPRLRTARALLRHSSVPGPARRGHRQAARVRLHPLDRDARPLPGTLPARGRCGLARRNTGAGRSATRGDGADRTRLGFAPIRREPGAGRPRRRGAPPGQGLRAR